MKSTTYPTKDDAERQQKLRHNTSSDPGSKKDDEVDSMHPDSWAGGSINPDAKKVARGEAPANRVRGDGAPPEAEYEDSTEITRPWAPRNPEEEGVDVDAAGRPKAPTPKSTN